ncbi:hypothetical protein [Acetobacter malorum]|uniref:hypothetical protein n=1 Tax=Acetobacter malorum TaxID=178901 RepID=UPI0039EBD09B
MIKRFFLLAFLATPSVAFGQVAPLSRPNHTLPQYSSVTAANGNAGAPRTMLRMATPSAIGGNSALWPPGGIRKDTRVPALYADGSTGTLEQIGRMADSSVQQTDVGATVAPLDASGMMSAPVSGDSSNAAISTMSAAGDAVFPDFKSRKISEHFSDFPTLRDFGMHLAPNQGTPDLIWLQSKWQSLNGYTPAILPAGAHWPDNSQVPDSAAVNKANNKQFPVVMSLGRVTSRPGYNTPYGFGVPYYGDVVPSFTHDDADFTFARVDSHESGAGQFVPIVSVMAVYDTPHDGGSTGGTNNQLAMDVKTVTTEKDKGTYGNFVSEFYSKGYNYWGEMDVNKWSHTVGHGTNWLWDNIQELYSAEPYYCDPTDTSLCFAEYMNEEDMYGVGPEQAASAYDPSVHNRQMFWLSTNHNIKQETFPTLKWSANTVVPAHKIILVKNRHDNKEYMFSGKAIGYKNNGAWTITGTISGNTLTVTSLSPGKKIIPKSTVLWQNIMVDEVKVTAQVSGITGGAGRYILSATKNPNGFNIPGVTDFLASDGNSSARFTTTGKTEPKWTFSTGDTFFDNTTQWTCIGGWDYDLGAVISIGGANDPDKGYVERIGTLLEEHTDYIYNAAIDMSKAAFDPSVPYKVFSRLQKDMYFDLTADGTRSGQNNHLLGYDNASKALTYKVNGVPVMSIKDSGAIISSAPPQMPVMTRAQIRAYPSPAKGMEIYDSDDDAPAIYTRAGWKLMSLSALPTN